MMHLATTLVVREMMWKSVMHFFIGLKSFYIENYCGIWHIHGVVSVLGTEIISVYSQYGAFTDHQFMHRACVPRDIKTGN